MLMEAIKLTYENVGILENDKDSCNSVPPKFSNIKKTLREIMLSSEYKSNKKEIERLLTRLESIFDINLFSKET